MAKYEIRIQDPFFWYSDADSALCSAYKLWEPFIQSHQEKLRIAANRPNVAEREHYAAQMGQAEEAFQLASLTYAPNALMLLGYAVENAAKGLKVQLDSATIWPPPSPGTNPVAVTKLPEELKNHSVGPDYLKATLSLSDEEEELLKSLSEFTVWKGRYSAPTQLKADSKIEWATDWFEKAVSILAKLEAHSKRTIFEKARAAGVPGL